MASQPWFPVIMAVKAAALCALCWAALFTIAFWSQLVPWMNYVAEFHTGEQCFRHTQLVCQITKVHTWQLRPKRKKHRCCSLADRGLKNLYLPYFCASDVSQIRIRIHGLHHKALKFSSCCSVFKSNSSYAYPHILFIFSTSNFLWE